MTISVAMWNRLIDHIASASCPGCAKAREVLEYCAKGEECYCCRERAKVARAALATIDSGAVPECPDCKTVREWLAGERVAVQNYDRRHDSMAVSVTEDILDRLEEATNA